jgi:hypothetical protein
VTEPLSIYLNDHLAGATLGVELARRLRSSNEGDDEFGPPLRRLCGEIEADKQTLEALMERRGIARHIAKPAAAWVAEKVGRLKLNGQLHGYSPLSRLIELEGLGIGIAGKAELWRALAASLGEESNGVDFAALVARADGQREAVEELHRRAARAAFGAPVVA